MWSGVMTGGIALGSVMSGVLVQYFWWGSVFLVNLPAMALLLVLGPVLLPESRDPAPGRFDWLSVPLSMAAVLPVDLRPEGDPVRGLARRSTSSRSPSACSSRRSSSTASAPRPHR